MRISSTAVMSVALSATLAKSAKAFGMGVSRTARRGIPLAMVSTATESTDAAPADAPSNPLLDQAGLPRFASIEPSHLTPAVTDLLAKLDADFASLEEKLSSSSSASASDFDDVLPAVERIQSPLGYVWGVAGHLNGVKNGDELREAYEKNQPGVVQAMTRFSQSRPLYDALKGIEASWEASSASESGDDDFYTNQKRRAVEGNLRSMTLGGVGLEGERKERFNEMRMRLAELSTKFGNNVLDATKAYGLTIEDPAEVEGVPASARAMWAQAYKMHAMSENPDGDDEPNVDAEKGPWRITLDGPSYVAVLSHLPNREYREKVYRAYLTRASEMGDEAKNNVPLINEILKIKNEMSAMLGFENYAEQSLAQKMAPSPQAVAELTDLIADRALPAAAKELEEITALARERGGDEYSEDNLEKLMPWDTTFWSERLKETKFDLTEEELRPYFALPAVLDGMFGLVRRIFDVEVVAADGEAEVWHPDVRFFNVKDASTGKRIASFYLDPFSRPADKRGGAWMDVCIGKSEACERDVPVAYLTCNGSPPVGDTPSLMTFREVETLFHEFGHGLQHMLTEASVGDVAGINGVEWDAVELPSQFMENWCYDKPTVYGFARHYETGEPLPEEMFEKLKEQKTYGAGMMACRQLYFGQLDMELHSSYDPEGDETIFDVQRRVAAKYVPYSMPLDEDRFLCSFGHIFGGGYAAGYYSYKWAEVMSADAFGAFEDAGLDDEDKVKEVGMKFRETVLSLGGGVEPMEVFKRFRGREPTPDALLRHNGLM
eukprot:CAMPEP_0183295840 /NCGR_PEP_ID=MMETSP0160_2-20130417/3637_1 /TAXON_ID=2839 ORGANISM="Odontella Sinensis, Strain Grunow 1884" /NCGR_SAMPLE_ID=MMETSP0160_2 /ASSEMBLY_ACC=CAM_ASM_000250 /LENGTH=776 /DNA_ID=CAMNT_0025457377 /DNA_START=88 /DNA_END=2418 /DNA_ORIENTATION=+